MSVIAFPHQPLLVGGITLSRSVLRRTPRLASTTVPSFACGMKKLRIAILKDYGLLFTTLGIAAQPILIEGSSEQG
ncbi:hypothetical protein, partial [Pseudomonas amygdali]|uniref:hypothetical protein n=1 Tax=Pseudomonas amygdali TaxID=47877 RepID=UPI001C81A9E1